MSNAIKLRVLGLAIVAAAMSGCNSEAAPESINAVKTTVKIRHQVDEARGRVWLLTRTGILVFDVSAPRAIRRVALPDWMWVGEPIGCLPDLAIGPKGEAVVSSDVVATLWRVDPETFEVSQHALALDADTDKDFGFTKLRYSAKQNAYLAVSTFYGSLWRIDPLLGRAQKLALAAPVADICRPNATLRRVLPQGVAYR